MIYIYAYIYNTCIHVYIYIYNTCIYIYTYIHTYIHTYIYTFVVYYWIEFDLCCFGCYYLTSVPAALKGASGQVQARTGPVGGWSFNFADWLI